MSDAKVGNLRRGESRLAVNQFAKEKTGNMLLAEREFLKLRFEGIQNVALKQISWIGKKKEDLIVLDSSYQEKVNEELTKALLEIQNYTHEEYVKKKEEIAQQFRKKMTGDKIKKNGSFSKEKFFHFLWYQ